MRGPKYFPDCEGADGVSQPRARDVPAGADSRRVNSATVSGRRMGAAGVEHGMGELGEIGGGREKPGVSGYAAEDAGIFVLHFALDDAIAESAAGGVIASARRGLRFRRLPARVSDPHGPSRSSAVGGIERGFLRRIEGCIHAERGKDFAPAKTVERFVGEAFERNAEKNKSDVAVFGAGARIGASGVVKAACRNSSRVRAFRNNFSYAGRPEEWSATCERLLRDGADPSRHLRNKFGNDGGDRSIEIEQSALVKKHRHGRRRHDFGERGKIEESRR